MFAVLLGGIGMFLLGMALLTDGLKTLAGDRLRVGLARLTGNRWSAFATGAGATALVQSSSATTLATIGMVSAGLMTLPGAIGVVIGANVGTTSTGWIVSVLGFKADIGAAALPMIGVGVLIKLLSRDRHGALGLAVAGFGLIFAGIDVLKDGMGDAAGRFTVDGFGEWGVWGRLALVGVGAAMTVVMQSSSAAVATTLAAMHAGAVRLEEATALVIGQNIGTTATAVIAGIGATVSAKRTAAAHIVFNVGTGVAAFVLAPWFVLGARAADPAGADRSEVALALFHTAFNVLGAMLFLPWVGVFARVVRGIVPERGEKLTRRLDRSVLSVGSVAVDAGARTAREIGGALCLAGVEVLTGARRGASSLASVGSAVEELREFLRGVRTETRSTERAKHLSVLHAADHLERLASALEERGPGGAARSMAELGEMRDRVVGMLEEVGEWFGGERADAEGAGRAEVLSREIADARRDARTRTLEETAEGRLTAERAEAALEGTRWMDRLGYHVWRAAAHLAEGGECVRARPSSEGEEEVGARRPK
ncbi:MAG: Na/Pi cotransporter family protein [Phycisphaerales bacterium]